MMYIVDKSCISPQNTFGDKPFEGGVIEHSGTRYEVHEPDYSGLIPRGQLRRMGKFSRLGVAAGASVLARHNQVEGILIGTANGGLDNTVKFLDQIMAYDEGTLTPTNFVQSTPNAVAGTLALSTHNTGYNATYVSVGLAFETALADALLLASEGEAQTLLVGSVEEISDYNHNIDTHRNLFKKEKGITSNRLLQSGTPGSVAGEGAAMFLLSAHGDDSAPEVRDVRFIQTDSYREVENAALAFLEANGLSHRDISTVIAGLNGDADGDLYYHHFLGGIFDRQQVVTFKNLVGEYPTASGFALWLAAMQGPLPEEAIFRKGDEANGYILIYNHYRRLQHGFILVKNDRFGR